MTNRMAIVPVEVTDEMHKAALDDRQYYRGLKHSYDDILAASPHAGKVSAEDLETAALALEFHGWRVLDPSYSTSKDKWAAFQADGGDGVYVQFDTHTKASDYCHEMNARAVITALGLEIE